METRIFVPIKIAAELDGKNQVWIDIMHVYCWTLKTQHLDNSYNVCLEQEGRTIILVVC